MLTHAVDDLVYATANLADFYQEARSSTSNLIWDTTYADFDVWFPIVSQDRRHLKTSHGHFLLINACAFTIHEDQLTSFEVIA